MDPQACLKELLDAVYTGEFQAAQDHLFDLASWIERGGWCPVVTPDMVATIIERRRQMRGDVP